MSWLYQDANCIFSLEQCFWVLIIQTIAWALAAVYFDNVQPNRHGVRLSYWYPLMPSYWRNLFRAGTSAESSGPNAGARTAISPGGGKQHSPFAAPDAARKVAKAISGVKEDEQLVIRCTSSAGGAGPDAIAARGLAGAATQGSMASTRHSVSSGMLRRRDNRQSDSAGASSRDSIAGELVTLPSRNHAVGITGRAMQYPGQHSTQLMINPSVTTMRLSDASSAEGHMGMVHMGSAAAGASNAAAPGTTITLQQYQQLQDESKQRAAASKRWWEFWRVSKNSLTSTAKKQDSMVGAAAASAPPASAALHNREAVGTYGFTPVVLDAGVVQEEQRMKAALFGGEG
jgi:hypothetical protein